MASNTLQESFYKYLNSIGLYTVYFQFAPDQATFPYAVVWTVAGEDQEQYLCDEKGGEYIMQIDLYNSDQFILTDDRQTYKNSIQELEGDTYESFYYERILLSDTPDLNTKVDNIYQQSIQATITWG